MGPRDGLQPEAPVAVADRVRLIEALIVAGVARIEVAAFVSSKAVPAMASAAEVVAAVTPRPGLVRAALVPNLRGAEMALAAGVDEITVTISASDTYNQRNVHMATSESEAVVRAIVTLADGARREGEGEGEGSAVPVDAVISCAFGSPYEREITPTDVADLARRLMDSGVATLTYADTTGMATPRRIAEVVEAIDVAGMDRSNAGLHLHDTRGTALVNAHAALGLGITRFDTSVGGLGGSPFADGAGGNLATETLVALLDDLGVDTGIDIDALVEAALLVEKLVAHPVPSGVAHHGPRHRRPS